jgi:DNA-directed RNA polymerase subunit E'/Rpb7
MESLLRTERVSEVVKVHPKFVAGNLQDIVLVILREKYEGKASMYGYIRHGSIKFASISAAQVEYHTLHGFVNVDVVFTAEVFKPPKESVVETRIMDMNEFGYKASSFLDGEVVIEIIVPNQLNVKYGGAAITPGIGDVVRVKIIDTRVDHTSKRISAIAHFTETELSAFDTNKSKTVTVADGAGADADTDILVEDEDDILLLENSDSETDLSDKILSDEDSSDASDLGEEDDVVAELVSSDDDASI